MSTTGTTTLPRTPFRLREGERHQGQVRPLRQQRHAAVKLLTGGSGYDVVYPSVEYAGKQIQAGIFQPLDKSKLPNLKNIDPVILKALQVADPGNKYLVPYMWFTTGVAINVDKVSKALGGKLPDNAWDLLFDPKVTDKLKDCGISMMDEASDLVPAAMLYAGRTPPRWPPPTSAPRSARHAGAQERAHLQLLADRPDGQGSVCVAMMFSGDAMIAGDRAKESNTGVKVQYIIPRTGAMMSIDVMAIPKDAQHVGNAHAWINTMMDPQVISKISNETFYISANTAALPMMDKALTDNPMINVPDDLKAVLHPKPVLTQVVQRELTRALSRFKTAK